MARDAGAGIYVSDSAKLNVTDTTLTANAAQVKGGALAVSYNAHVYADNMVLAANTARDWGGAMQLNKNATLVLKDADVRGNKATTGGGLHATGEARVTLSSSRLTYNTAKYGGAVCISGASKVLLGHIQGLENSATQGGVFFLEESAQAVIDTSMFVRNSVQPSKTAMNILGGFLMATGSPATVITNTTIEGHVRQPGVLGGAIYISRNASLDLMSCTLSHFHASLLGGGIVMHDNSSLNAHNTNMTNITSEDAGGALWMGVTCSGCSVAWAGSSFVNTSATYGGAMWIGNGAVALQEITIVNSQADKNGGALLANNAAHLAMARCAVHNSRSILGNGGGMMAVANSQVQMTKCQFLNCTAKFDGAAVAATEAASLHLQSSLFEGNFAGGNGGGLSVDGSVQLIANNCRVLRNRCSSWGGGVDCRGNASVELHNCLVSTNEADLSGGGISVVSQAALTMRQTKVIGNGARSRGGGVAVQSPHFDLVQLKAAAHENRAGTAARDLYVVPTTLVNTNGSSVERFVSRLNSDEGLVNATLRAIGPHGLPSEGVNVVAMLNEIALATTKSGADGLAHLFVKLRKPPGMSRVHAPQAASGPMTS
jgi:predicted outer membrane repeat protein